MKFTSEIEKNKMYVDFTIISYISTGYFKKKKEKKTFNISYKRLKLIFWLNSFRNKETIEFHKSPKERKDKFQKNPTTHSSF